MVTNAAAKPSRSLSKGCNRPFVEQFSSRLRTLRLKAQLTQQDVIERLSDRRRRRSGPPLSVPTWSQWESGNRLPHIERLPDIANALGCQVWELFR